MYRDRGGQLAARVKAACRGEEPVFARAIAMEILQGCSTDAEWTLTNDYLEGQTYLEMSAEAWVLASRIFFDLQRTGTTVRSSLDCCRAQIALDHDCTVVHDDRDFEIIATVRPLKQIRLKASP